MPFVQTTALTYHFMLLLPCVRTSDLCCLKLLHTLVLDASTNSIYYVHVPLFPPLC